MSDSNRTEPIVCYIGLGSNLGDREANLRCALEQIAQEEGVEITRVSRFYETEPVGGPPQGMYLNGAAELATTLPPEELLDALQRVEKRLGRKRGVKWGPRKIDLDILLYAQEVIRTERLTVPHPLMHERRFVLEPLCEIAPGAFHPVLRKTASELLRSLHEARPHGRERSGGM